MKRPLVVSYLIHWRGCKEYVFYCKYYTLTRTINTFKTIKHYEPRKSKNRTRK